MTDMSCRQHASDPIIEVRDVSKNYKNVQALNDVSLSVNAGKIFGLIGPDGAGKSTLIHLMTGVLSTKKGKIEVLGKDVLKKPESVKSSIGFLPQGLGLSLAQELSVEENINFFAEINGVDGGTREKRKELLLGSTGLSTFKDREAKNLSGGMKQKLALCCTLIHEPPLIFLDEPTTGVDPISRRDIWTLVNTMVKDKNLTFFITTSYMDEAARCHEIIMMHEGKIIEEGDPDSMPKKLKGKFAQIDVKTQEDQQSALSVFKHLKDVKMIYPMGHRLNLIYDNVSLDQIKAEGVSQGAKIEKMETETPGIEDVFLSKITEGVKDVDEKVFEEFFQRDENSNHDKSLNKVMIQTHEIEKKFGDFVAVNKISFDVKRGEIFGFLGPNGAGKTTTIKMLCGLYPPTSGKGEINNLDLFESQFEIKKRIGYMSQKFSLYRDLTVSENIMLYGGIYNVQKDELIRRRELILKIAGLEGQGDFITGDLPMGIKQRLALGCAIIHKPDCIFLDEPTSGVDPIARRQFWDIIYLLSRRMGVTVLVTTHYMDEAEHCDRLSLMTNGSIVALGSPQDLKNDVTAKIGVLLELSTNDPFKSVDVLSGNYKHCSIFGAQVHIYTQDPKVDEKKIQQLLKENNINLKEIRASVMPFEDVFVYYCEKGAAEG